MALSDKAKQFLFDALANDPELHIMMRLQAGDMQFVHNHNMLHDRTAFVDWSEPSRRRHLLRLWLNDAAMRPMPADRLERRNRGLHLKHVKRIVPLELQAAV